MALQGSDASRAAASAPAGPTGTADLPFEKALEELEGIVQRRGRNGSDQATSSGAVPAARPSAPRVMRWMRASARCPVSPLNLPLLDRVRIPADLRQLPESDLAQLAAESSTPPTSQMMRSSGVLKT
jgi:hypothetical protein